jgi:molybdate transport system substrate-binding protein
VSGARVRVGGLALAGLLAAAGCGSGDGPRGAAPSGSALTGRVDVFAAASLTEAFERLGDTFEAAHPGTTVVFSFAASSSLAQSIVGGAPADVFAAASPATMQVVTDAGDARDPAVFARNLLELAVPAGNSARVRGLADLARPELAIALCAPQVPCGAAAAGVLERAGIQARPDTLEQDVRAVLAKVRLGEVDAALVYRTDVLAAREQVQGVPVPEAAGAVNDYLLAPLTDAPDRAAAQAFVAHVLSSEGRQALADAGFQPV